MTPPLYLGIDIGGTNIKIGLVTAKSRVIARGVIPTVPANTPLKTFRRIERTLPALSSGTEKIAATGVGCAGLINSRGVLLSSPNLPVWKKVPLRALARRVFDVPAVVDNDATAAAYGEFVAGAGKSCSHFICITLGTGVGGGIIVGGEPLRGSENFAGELGHMTIDTDGPRCACGNRGCLEAFIGTRGLLRSARAKLKTANGKILGSVIPARSPKLTPLAIAEAARLGDRIARAVLDEAAAALGCGIASLVNIFNPEVVAIGGGISGAFDLMKDRVEREVHERSYVAEPSRIVLTRAVLGNDASIIGAAMLAAHAR